MYIICKMKKTGASAPVFCILNRRNRIRTCDLTVPNGALYQPEPYAEIYYYYIKFF